MARLRFLLVLVVALILAPWPAVGASEAFGRPELPALPDLDRWAAILEDLQPPPRKAGAIAIRPAQEEPILRVFLAAARAMPRWGGEALVVVSGVHDLEDVASAAGRPDLLLCRPDGCELRAPLLVRPGAGLVVARSRARPLRLRLDQEAGAFVVNTGTLHIAWASILGWSSSQQALAATGGERFRPFLAAFGASDTIVLQSELDHLGFQGAKAYGLSLSSHPRLFPGAQPSGRLFANRLNQLYYGLFTYEARSVVVMANVFSGSRRYGIDPHDASSRLLIARNEIYGSQGHGLVVSKRVDDSWIVENLSRDNARSGLVLDAGSSHNLIAGNRLIDNRRDGIAVFESHENTIASNRIERNGGAGIRIRASAANVVAENLISGSGEYGLVAYDRSESGQALSPKNERHQRPVTLALFGNSFAANAMGACQFKSVREVIAYADDSGELKPCGEALSISGDEAGSLRGGRFQADRTQRVWCCRAIEARSGSPSRKRLSSSCGTRGA
jgi:poly(beta-D-mannuronate) C5 epimerase